MKTTKPHGLQFFPLWGNRMGLQKIKMASRSILLLLAVVLAAFSLMSASCSREDDELEIPSAPEEAPLLTMGNAEIEVEWSPVADATSYEVWINTSNSTSTADKALPDVTENNCVVDGLENGTTYHVWVKAKNKKGTSGFSPSASGTPGSGSNNQGRDVYYDGTIAFTSVGTYEGEVYNESTIITEFKIIPWSAPEDTWRGYDWGFTLEVEVDDVIDTNPPIPLKYSGKKRIPEGEKISLHIYKTPGGTYSYNLSLFNCKIEAGDWFVPLLEPPYYIIEGGSLDYDFLPLVIRGETTRFYRNVVPIKTTWKLNCHNYKYDGGQALSPLNSKGS